MTDITEGVMDDLLKRLRERARIRRQISTRKSVQEGQPDRIADLLDEAADMLATLRTLLAGREPNPESVIRKAQDILAEYIVPDSGISDHECINRLLGLLDGPECRVALSRTGADEHAAPPNDDPAFDMQAAGAPAAASPSPQPDAERKHPDCEDRCQILEHKGYHSCSQTGRCEQLETMTTKKTDYMWQLEDALEPFAKLLHADGHMNCFHDLPYDSVVYQNCGHTLTAGDFRRAANAYARLRAAMPPAERGGTPETDAAEIKGYEDDGTLSRSGHVPVEFARSLERRLRAAPAPREGWVSVPRIRLESLLEYWNGHRNEQAMFNALEHIQSELTQMLATAPAGERGQE